MTDSKNRNAAGLIWNCWQNGTVIDNLPKNLRPATRAEGYAIQAQVTALSDASIFGWKIAATSTAGRDTLAFRGLWQAGCWRIGCLSRGRYSPLVPTAWL